MKHTLRYIVVFVLAGVIAGFLIMTSLAFEKTITSADDSLKNPQKIVFSQPVETSGKPELDVDGKIIYKKLSEEFISEGSIFVAEFGRLANGFFLSQSAEMPIKTQITRQDKNIFVEKIRGIFSWYDPFDVYVVSDVTKNFAFKQITSGSFYLSHENDGTIVLYSIDMVGELSFLHEGVEKTKMILFPGMYFRFDPEMNKNLAEKADLLGIIQAQGKSEKNTSISFVNPRIEVADAREDSIVPFVLKQSAGKLFDYLRLVSKERLQTVSALKEYANVTRKNLATDVDIQNPTKRMYRLLGELQTIFSQAVNSEIEVEEFRSKIENILEQTEEFELENTAEKMIEQFLIDGRFALFMGNNDINAHYQKLYDEAANILQINPTTGKGKMFQVLSNIFSRNILEDKMSVSQMSVDTITVLNNTLSQAKSEIANNDYFDLSLYLFLILRTMPDVQDTHKAGILVNSDVQMEKMSLGLSVFSEMMLGRLSMEQDATYKVYAAIFNATQRYVNSIEATEKNSIQTALATDLYSPMLYLLVNSLYQTYTISENNELYLAVAYLNRGVPELSTHNHGAIVNNLTNTHAMMKDIYDRHIVENSKMSAVSKLEIEKYLVQLKGFIDMLSEGVYSEYEVRPYVVDNNSVLPKYNSQARALERKQSTRKVEAVKTEMPATDSGVVQEVVAVENISQNSEKAENI